MPAMAVRAIPQYRTVLPEVRPEAMGPVREIVRAHLRLWRKSKLSDLAVLGVTELLTNVLKHAPGDCELLMRETPDGVFVGVTDCTDSLPTVREPSEGQTGGWGLFLLADIADELDVKPLAHGKQVWFRLGGACAEDQRECPSVLTVPALGAGRGSVRMGGSGYGLDHRPFAGKESRA